MIRHYYTLFHIAREIATLRGSKLIECFSQEKDSALLALYNGESLIHIKINTAPFNASVFIDYEFNRAGKNSVDIFPELLGQTLIGSEIIMDDRIIKLEFNDYIAYAIMYGASKSNFIICTLDGTIVNALNKARIIIGSKFTFDASNLKSLNEFQPEEKLMNAIAKCDLLLGKQYAEELLLREGLEPGSSLGSVSDKTQLLRKAMALKNECFASEKSYLLRKETNGSVTVSLIKLQGYEIAREYDSTSNAIKFAIRHNIIQALTHKIYVELESFLKREIHRLSRKAEKMREIEFHFERADKYKLWADLIMSYPNPKEKGNKEIALEDWNGNLQVIPLDNKVNLLLNAKKLYDKSRKIWDDLEITEKAMPAIEARLAEYNGYMELIEKTFDYKTLTKIKNEINAKWGKKMNFVPKSPEEKYKTFDLGGGYTLYVGRNAANNDELTMKFAKPNDLWFHARGSSGSHCVLRAPGGTEKVAKDVIKRAAEICAYFSGARNAKYTPVCYCPRKNVRKPKGANVGAVVISREEVIMVEPKLPETDGMSID